MKYSICLAVCGFSLSAATVYNTAAPFTGTRSIGLSGGLAQGGGTGFNNLTLSWSIVELPDSTYDYTYTIAGVSTPLLSHFLLELSPVCLTPGQDCVTNPEVNGSPASTTLGYFCYGSAGCQGKSNVGLPSGFDGVKFESMPASPGPVIITFNSAHVPVWGDFYLKGGQQYVYNLGNLNHLDSNTQDFVARPDTYSGAPQTPEPATLGLVGAALDSLGMFKRSRRRL